MPFICLYGEKVVYAEDLLAAEWENLKLRVQSGPPGLKLPCCGARVSLRSGRSHRQHFAHYPGESCKSDAWSEYSGRPRRTKGEKPESLDHQRVKQIIAEVAEKTGWCTRTEHEGHSPSGGRWVADVLIEKGESKVAFEVQVSPQQFSDYRIRQQRYRESGIKCLWLTCVMPAFSDEEIPVFELSRSNGVFVVDFPEFFRPGLLKLPSASTGVSLGEFVQLLLERRIVWEQDWVNKHDQLASMEDRQRLPVPAAERGGGEIDPFECYSGYTAIKERGEAKKTLPGPEPTATLPVGVKLPDNYDPRIHCLTVMFFGADGRLTNFYFRGELSTCKNLIRMELLSLPSGTYAEVYKTRTDIKVPLNCDPPPAQQIAAEKPKIPAQFSLFD
jgi:hypothetical protein